MPWSSPPGGRSATRVDMLTGILLARSVQAFLSDREEALLMAPSIGRHKEIPLQVLTVEDRAILMAVEQSLTALMGPARLRGADLEKIVGGLPRLHGRRSKPKAESPGLDGGASHVGHSQSLQVRPLLARASCHLRVHPGREEGGRQPGADAAAGAPRFVPLNFSLLPLQPFAQRVVNGAPVVARLQNPAAPPHSRTFSAHTRLASPRQAGLSLPDARYGQRNQLRNCRHHRPLLRRPQREAIPAPWRRFYRKPRTTFMSF